MEASCWGGQCSPRAVASRGRKEVLYFHPRGLLNWPVQSTMPGGKRYAVDWFRNVMAHAQKPHFVFRRNGRVHLNRRGASVQSTTGSRDVSISGSNAGYTMFRGSVKSTGYPLHSPVSPSLPLPVRHRVPSHFNWTLRSVYYVRVSGLRIGWFQGTFPVGRGVFRTSSGAYSASYWIGRGITFMFIPCILNNKCLLLLLYTNICTNKYCKFILTLRLLMSYIYIYIYIYIWH